jgi:hypothetical protein
VLVLADCDAGFPVEANAVLEELVHHQILQADVLAYEQDGVPYVQLFQTLPTGNVSHGPSIQG